MSTYTKDKLEFLRLSKITKSDLILFLNQCNNILLSDQRFDKLSPVGTRHKYEKYANSVGRLSEILYTYFLFGKSKQYVIEREYEIKDIFFMTSYFTDGHKHIDLYDDFIIYQRDKKISELC